MRSVRIVLLILSISVLAACGRVLPDETPASSSASSDSASTTVEETPTEAADTSDAAAEDTSSAESTPAETTSSSSTDSTAATTADDPIAQAVAAADPANGEVLFAQMTSTGFACTNCHNIANEDRLVGPGMLNVGARAWTRVPGVSAPDYIYNSILHPNDHIVESYPENVMPAVYETIFTEDQLYDIVAYMMTLGESAPPAAVASGTTDDSSSEDATPVEETPSEDATEEPATEEPAEATPETIVVTQVVVVTATPGADEAAAGGESSETATEEATLEPTPEPTQSYVVTLDGLGWGVPVVGEQLFTTAFIDEQACSDCHYAESDEVLVGQGMAGLSDRALEAGQQTQTYAYRSIIDPDVHPDLSRDYVDVLSDTQIADLVAYMLTLREGGGAEEDSIGLLVANADAAHGETLFNEMTSTGFACVTCHHVDSTEMLVGPGLLGLPDRAGDRVPGQTAERYIFNSVTHPNEYIVETYPESVMPQTYTEVFSTSDIYDIIAYLMTLGE
ncbi:MAG: cytochrome c [Anaerolineaceae bacterium]|nr:cytochrome c [Anaerolineaceae bacterium]